MRLPSFRATGNVTACPWSMPAAIGSAVLGGLVMAYARVALGVHFPSDTFGGLLLGICSFALTAVIV
jgi:membrane-associated phospholipid phosphatase